MSDIEVTMSAKNEASKVLRDFKNQVAEDTKAVELSFKGMVQGLAIGVMVTGINKAAAALTDFGNQALAAFDKANDASKKLSESLQIFAGLKAVEVNANGIDATTVKFERLANDLERLTNFDSENIKRAMAGAVRDGATVGELEDMTRAAVGLARAFDTDVASGMLRVRQAMEGNFGPFKTMEELTRAAEQGLKNAAVAANEGSQSQKRLTMEWNNFLESAGRAIDPIRDFVSEGLLVVTNAVRQHVLPALESMEDIISDGITVAAAIGEAAIQNFSQIAQTSFDSVSLGLEVLRSQFEYVFTEAIVGYLEYFGREAADMASVVYKVFDNLGYNISNAIVRARSSPEVAKQLPFRDLTDMGDVGFMGGGAPPDLSQGRKVSDFETQLRERLTQNFGDLFENLHRTVEERLSQRRQRQPVPEVPAINLRQRGGVAGDGSGAGDPTLRAFQNEILRFGPQTPSPDKQVELMQKQIDEQKQTREAIEALNRNIGKWKGGEIFLRPIGE